MLYLKITLVTFIIAVNAVTETALHYLEDEIELFDIFMQ